MEMVTAASEFVIGVGELFLIAVGSIGLLVCLVGLAVAARLVYAYFRE